MISFEGLFSWWQKCCNCVHCYKMCTTCLITAKILNDEELIPLTVNLGADRAALNTHSNRKGAATFLCGLSMCLSAVNIYLRAGWSIGSVQDRYIFGGAGGDQVVGRAVAGLPINSTDFAILPPHFTSEGLKLVHKIGLQNLVEGYEGFPECFKRVAPMLVARVIYGYTFLQQFLDARHPLWNQRLFAR